MKYFDKYSSNTTAGSGNQSYFLCDDENKLQKGRVFYKLFAKGTYNYSILFSNIIDSTFQSGAFSHKNLVLDEWYIDSLRLGVCSECGMDKMPQIDSFCEATFDGKKTKRVSPGEIFYSDGVEISANEGDYLCLEIAFHGKNVPCHPETMLPSFVFENGEWVKSFKMPFASMIGCDRKVKTKVGFIGDSITQGIGPSPNSYKHYVALTADRLDKENSYWNLGLGYARADDAGSDGVWLFKAKAMDVVSVCFGVNDILQGHLTQGNLKRNLTSIVDKLKASGVRVLIQTIPPFDYSPDNARVWSEANEFIRRELSNKCDAFFDCVPILSVGEERPQGAKYGGHPNEKGCEAWAEALAPCLKMMLEN